MSARTFLGSPLNVADQGAYNNTFLHASHLNWEPVQGEKGATGLTAMPKGLLRAVLFGDPNLPGLCMFRMKYPPNYRVPPHFHWMAEHTSVLEGEAYFGLGDTFDESKLIKWNAGDYFTVSVGTPHYVLTKDSSPVFELHVMGPWQMTYANPDDHPHK